MSSEEKILSELESLRKEVQKIYELLVGNKINGKLGLIDMVENLQKEIYGDPKYKITGLKESQEMGEEVLVELKEELNRLKWTAIGWAGGVSAAVSVLAYFLKSQFGK
jgi:hypothetical protein